MSKIKFLDIHLKVDFQTAYRKYFFVTIIIRGVLSVMQAFTFGHFYTVSHHSCRAVRTTKDLFLPYGAAFVFV